MILQNKENLKKNLINQNEIIMQYTPLVKLIAKKMAYRINNNLEFDELVNIGVIGLINAISKYDYNNEKQFKNYVELRVRGAMLDYLREIDDIPRSVRDRVKKINEQAKKIESKYKRKATNQEIAKSLKMNINDFNHYKKLSNVNTFKPSEEINSNDNVIRNKTNNPEQKYFQKEFKTKLIDTLKNLKKIEQTVLKLYYFEELNLKEMSKILGISISRISQIHKTSINKLKDELEAKKSEFFSLIS